MTFRLLSTHPGMCERARRQCRWWSLHKQLVEIGAGRMRWFGVRPRSQTELQALPAAWAQALQEASVGMLVFPAREDLNPTLSTAQLEALADLYWLSQPSWKQKWEMCRHIATPRQKATPQPFQSNCK